MTGFKKAGKKANSEVSLLAGDLEMARRIARLRRFDEITGACVTTITRLAGPSGLIAETDATQPPRLSLKNAWPPAEKQRNATKLYKAIYKAAGGLNKPVKLTTRALATLAYPDVKLKEGKRRAYRAVRVLAKKAILQWTPGQPGRYDAHGNAIPNTYELLRALTTADHFPERAEWLKAEMTKRGVSIRKLSEDGPDRITIRRVYHGQPVTEKSLENLRVSLSAYGQPILPSDIPSN